MMLRETHHQWSADEFIGSLPLTRGSGVALQLAVSRRTGDSFMGNGKGMSKRPIAAIVRWAQLSLRPALRRTPSHSAPALRGRRESTGSTTTAARNAEPPWSSVRRRWSARRTLCRWDRGRCRR